MIADPVASVAMSRASSIINNFNKLLSAEKKGLDEIKNEINTALLNIDIKIIVVIDDLDRLADTDIQEIFQLVRSIADFKNTIYILSYDEEIVSKALDKIQKDKGGKYIEKIVQVPIKLPKVSQENLKDIFIKKLKTIHIKHEALDKDEFIKKIKENNFADAFKSIRDMERFLNAFKIEINAINQELYLYDFAVITLLKIFEPRLYDYIYDNRMLFIEQEIKKITKSNKDFAFNLIGSIFPKINNQPQDYSQLIQNNTDNQKKRITYPSSFKYYFLLNFPK
ncbi:P-loop NTPase fold protein [Campylobacter coli]|uniref:P-loop NTPase fold protein n=1 Tax=Campylobacter coli TaxID=195 RepID=UPI00156FBF3C|nr:P-loop NTPase fold protein [Campylobacter coli]HEC2766701.1 NTPase [Campylobacter coli]